MSTFVHDAPGLPGDWLNGWLAAVGITRLCPTLQLSWTDAEIPRARFLTEDPSPLAEIVAEAFPTTKWIQGLAIARTHPGSSIEFGRNVGIEAFVDRARLARSAQDDSLGSTVTDLTIGDETKLRHSFLDAAAPHGETIWSRLAKVRAAVDKLGELSEVVRECIAGRGVRVPANGLGFDFRRLSGGATPNGGVHVDPVVECLAFKGAGMFPLRGDGKKVASQRGWVAGRGRGFVWPIWQEPLDVWAIDALLSSIGTDAATRNRLGVTRRFETVPYRATGQADTTRAFASRRLA